VSAKPLLYVEKNVQLPVPMVRSEEAAEASFAAILALVKLGTAIAATIRMIATTISNSIRENPF
jgi:hypothetical protein